MDLGSLVDARGMLQPAGPYTATLEDIYKTFVEDAPFRERRELIFKALALYSNLVWQECSDARLWIDGGFTTHKQWAEPEDADVAVIVPVREYRTFIQTDGLLPLHTLQHVQAQQPLVNTAKLHSMGGLVDSFIIPNQPAQLALWTENWSCVKGEDKRIVPGERKGFVEVTTS